MAALTLGHHLAAETRAEDLRPAGVLPKARALETHALADGGRAQGALHPVAGTHPTGPPVSFSTRLIRMFHSASLAGSLANSKTSPADLRMSASARPMNEPAMPATWLSPSTRPRSCAGKASVRIALELAISMAPPTPCKIRITISHQAAAVPCSQVSDSRMENSARTARTRD